MKTLALLGTIEVGVIAVTLLDPPKDKLAGYLVCGILILVAVLMIVRLCIKQK